MKLLWKKTELVLCILASPNKAPGPLKETSEEKLAICLHSYSLSVSSINIHVYIQGYVDMDKSLNFLTSYSVEEMAEFSDLEIINTMVLWFQRGKLSLSPSDCFDNAFSLFKVKMCYDAESK